MKQIKALLPVIIILTYFSSCGPPPVTFSEPQPSNTDNLSNFPNRLLGKYISQIDNSILEIHQKLIIRISDFDLKFHPSELDSNSRLLGDTIINLITNEREIIKRDGDSLVSHVHNMDTLFQINYDNVLRKFKGYYFINKRYSKESWEVMKVKLSKGQIVISSITSEKDIENLNAITETPNDTIAQHIVSPTKKQFKEFIKNEGFSSDEVFIKIK